MVAVDYSSHWGQGTVVVHLVPDAAGHNSDTEVEVVVVVVRPWNKLDSDLPLEDTY